MSDVRPKLLDALGRLVDHLTRRVDYLALYPCVVVAQRADGTLDLTPEDTRLPPPQGVPMRTLRGLSVEVTAGARVLMGFEAGDPSRPVALLWELGSATVVRVNSGTHRAAREGHSVSVTIPTGAVLIDSPGGPVTNPAPITLSGTITAGTDSLRIL